MVMVMRCIGPSPWGSRPRIWRCAAELITASREIVHGETGIGLQPERRWVYCALTKALCTGAAERCRVVEGAQPAFGERLR